MGFVFIYVSPPPYSLFSWECTLGISPITNCDVNSAALIIIVVINHYLIYAHHFSLETLLYPMHKCLALLQILRCQIGACCVDTTQVLRSTSLQKFVLVYLWH